MVNFIISLLILIGIVIMIVMTTVHAAETYAERKDNAGYTHYYNSKGHQDCVSKKDAAGYTHTYCN
jgi:hypothetical protein